MAASPPQTRCPTSFQWSPCHETSDRGELAYTVFQLLNGEHQLLSAPSPAGVPIQMTSY